MFVQGLIITEIPRITFIWEFWLFSFSFMLLLNSALYSDTLHSSP
nr:MAG TPA: hypothetical protein [Caudoviricetes sp.]